MMSWEPYQPTPSKPWDLQRVVHLHRRAVFGACREEVERDLAEDPQAAVTRILRGQTRLAGVPANFEDKSQLICQSAIDTGDVDRLAAWCLYRCLYSPDPLRERLTLMWHNHFATSVDKVRDLRLMHQQNQTMRKLANGNFNEMLGAMAQDPALLLWLDAPLNKAGRPNENLAREIMELFALGIGNYTEADIRESARTLTGSTVRNSSYHFNESVHDAGGKTILGQRGNWKLQDLVRILLQQDAVANRIAWRLTNEFFGENVVENSAIKELAVGLREHDLDIGWAVETMLRSQWFFCEANIQSRVSDPVSYALMPLRAMECWDKLPSTLTLSVWLLRMGQGLFRPPNVGGWDGGRTWLSTRTVVARTNYIHAIVKECFSYEEMEDHASKWLSQAASETGPCLSDFAKLLLGSQDSSDLGHARDRPVHADVNTPNLRSTLVRALTSPSAHLH